MEFKIVSLDRFNDVIQHLRESFFSDEPLNKAAKLCKNGEGNEELEQHSLSTLDDNLSLMAVNENDDIVGVILNGVLHCGDIERSQKKLEACQDMNFKKIFNLLYNENHRLDFFQNYNVDRLFDVRILSVDSKYRGQGIAKDLLIRSEELAKQRGFKLMKADATGIFSQKILKSLNFKVLSEVYYENYADENGSPLLNVESPHLTLQIMIKTI